MNNSAISGQIFTTFKNTNLFDAANHSEFGSLRTMVMLIMLCSACLLPNTNVRVLLPAFLTSV